MSWRRVLETQEFVVEQQDDTPATTRRFRIWRHQSPFAEVTVRVIEDEGGALEDIVIQPLIFRYRCRRNSAAALDPQELLRVVLEALPAELRR
jgi:hypothetical protein